MKRYLGILMMQYNILFVTQYGIFNFCEYLLDVIIYRVVYIYSFFMAVQTVGLERLEIWDTGVTRAWM